MCSRAEAITDPMTYIDDLPKRVVGPVCFGPSTIGDVTRWTHWNEGMDRHILTYKILSHSRFRGGCFLFAVAIAKHFLTFVVCFQPSICWCSKFCGLLWTIHCVFRHIGELGPTMIPVTVDNLLSSASFDCWEQLYRYLCRWCFSLLNI